MALPRTLFLALALLLTRGEAHAQPSPAREQRQRAVTITGNPADPPQELHAARGVSTVLVFKSQIDGGAAEVDRTRVKLLDTGEWSIIFEPVIDLGTTERLVLSVPFVDGKRAVFVLVSPVSEVDTRIDVIRREQTVESCQAELAEAQASCSKMTPSRLVRTGWLTTKGVIARGIKSCNKETRAAQGLVCAQGTAYRAEKWALVVLKLGNESDEPPWVPREATLKGTHSGVSLKGTVEMDAARIEPGEGVQVFVEVDPPTSEEPFVLELSDAAGRTITITGVLLAKPAAAEVKR